MNMPVPRLDLGPIAFGVQAFASGEAQIEVDPAVFLSDLIDIRGSVALVERLAALDDDVPAGDPRAALRARQRLAQGLAEIEARLTDAFDNALKPRYRLPTPQRALHVLVQADALKKRRGAPLRSATRNLWAPFGEFIDTQLRRSRFALAELRVGLASDLQALGGDAARLERLDAALEAATRHEVERLYRRIPGACEARFVEALQQTVAALPAEPTASDLAEAFGAWGWVADEMDRARGLVTGAVARERRRLVALVEAACAAAGRGRGADECAEVPIGRRAEGDESMVIEDGVRDVVVGDELVESGPTGVVVEAYEEREAGEERGYLPTARAGAFTYESGLVLGGEPKYLTPKGLSQA